MKYVIYKRKGLFLPITFPDHITHSQVVINFGEEVQLYSAGFFSLSSIGLPEISPMRSESLDIGPQELDKDILMRFYLNLGTANFIDYSHEEY